MSALRHLMKPAMRAALSQRRNLSLSSTNLAKVAVLGASGGIGQPLSLLLKLNPLVNDLALYDVAHTPGVAADLSHIDSHAKVSGHTGIDELDAALKGADIVVIPAGVPRKPGMTRDDLFNTNAGIVKQLCEHTATVCPKAIIAIVTNPVNSTVPIAHEVYKKKGVDPSQKVVGVTTLDVVRANTFVADAKNLNVDHVHVPVVGGHAGATIIPVFSQSNPNVSFPEPERSALIKRIQEAGTEVVNAKAGAGSATLSMAHAAHKFTTGLLKGLRGDKVVMCAYVSSGVTESPFFSTELQFGRAGVETNLGLGKLQEHELQLVQSATKELINNVKKGVEFANKN